MVAYLSVFFWLEYVVSISGFDFYVHAIVKEMFSVYTLNTPSLC